MKNTTQIGILCLGIQFKVVIFVLICDKARVVYNLIAFIK